MAHSYHFIALPASCSEENIAGNSSTLVGKAAEAPVSADHGISWGWPLIFACAKVGQKHSANEGVKMQMHQMLFGALVMLAVVVLPVAMCSLASLRLEQMFEGGKGVYAEGFGTLDEHRVLPRSSPCRGGF